jgi:hypothetical protein
MFAHQIAGELSAEYKAKFENVFSKQYNTAPKGWRKLTEEEFAKSMFFTYSPIALGYDQLLRDADGKRFLDEKGREAPAMSVKLFLMHDGTGFAMAHDFWGGKVSYYKFGCDHKYHEYGRDEAKEKGYPFTGGNCCHNQVCTVCGDFRFYDSGD